MSVIDVPKLLQEVSSGAPSGENLEYDPAFAEMVRLAQGKPEQQVGGSVVPAEEPNWREVKGKAVQLLGRSKDLRSGVYLARALLRTDGFPGFSEALGLLRGLLERHWETVYPQLDPEDNNDPTMRVNALVALCHPDTVLKAVRETPLVASRAHGRASLRDVLIATGKLPAPTTGAPVPEASVVEAAFREGDLEGLKGTAAALEQAAGHVQAIEAALTERVGSAQAASFGELSGVLKSALRVVNERLARRGVAVAGNGGDAEAAEGVVVGGIGAAQALATGPIATREDAMRVLDRVCEYFEMHEPSSPVPLLLRRAKRLVTKSFVDIVRDLAPEGLPQVEKIRGEEQ